MVAHDTGRDVRVVLEPAGVEPQYALKARTEVTVPEGCGRKALRTLVSKLLQLGDDVEVPDFHFAAVLSGERIALRTTLGKFLARHSVGDIALPLEYYVPISAPTPRSTAPPERAWVHALDSGAQGLISGSGCGVACVRDAKGGVVREVEAHTAPIKAVRWFGDGAEHGFITCGQDELVRTWREDGICVGQLRAEDIGACTTFESLAVRDELGAVGGFDGSVWLLPNACRSEKGTEGASGAGKRARPDVYGLEAKRLGAATGLCASAAGFDDDGMLHTGSWDGTVRVWDTQAGTCTATVPAGGRPLTALCASQRGTVVSAMDGAVRLLDARGEHGVVAACKRKAAHKGVVNDVAWVTKDTAFVSAGCDGTLRVWDLRSMDAALHVVRHAKDEVKVLAVAASQHTLASGGSDGRVATFHVK